MTETMDLQSKLAELQQMGMGELKAEYFKLYGDGIKYHNNKQGLIRKIAWRLQAMTLGGLSDRAKQRAEELANEADLRSIPPRPKKGSGAGDFLTGVVTSPNRDPRLPPAGTILTRKYKGQVLQVKVLEDGVEYAGEVFPSLTAAARKITGTHTNGFLFFRLGAVT